MKNIVLYLMIFFLAAATLVMGQKPTLDLLPATKQVIHPEAVIDTSSHPDSQCKIRIPERSASGQDQMIYDSSASETIYANQQRRLKTSWLQMDSLLPRMLTRFILKRIRFRTNLFYHNLFL